MIRYFVFFVFSSVIVFGITVYFRLGGYKKPSIEEQTIAAYFVLGKKHLGAYHKIGAVIDEVEKWAKENGVPCARTFGEYLDDPREKDEDRLQSIGGCVVGESPLALAAKANGTAAEAKTNLPADFILSEVAAGPRVIARFTGAPSIGPFKVYPAVEEYMTEKKLKIAGPVIEIYEIMGDRDARTEYQFKFSGSPE